MIQCRSLIISCLCMLVAFVFVQKIGTRANVEVIDKGLDNFPYRIGSFVGADLIMDAGVVKELNTDVFVFREYDSDKGEKIDLYIGYYGTKKGGRTGHNPYACYPGSGWTILDKGREKVRITFNGSKRIISLNILEVAKGPEKIFVYHWYQSNGDEVLSSGVDQNLYRFKRKILYDRNDGAFIRVSAQVAQSLPYTKNRLRNFIRKIFPLIVEHWPKEA